MATFAVGFYFGKSQCKICPPEDVDFSLFWEALDKLKENFVDKEKITPEKIVYGAISGLTKELGDPYTSFFTPKEKDLFEEEASGYFEGVGMEIGMKNNQIQVIAPLEGTPAQKAGILPGDKILKIDEKPTFEMSLEEAVRLIRGPAGTEVSLTILREGWDQPKVFKIKRSLIKIPTLKWEIKEGGIVYLKINQFTLTLPEDFRNFVSELLAKKTSKKMILDLRNNPGGYLDVAQEVANYFLKPGSVILVEQLPNGEKIKDYAKGFPVFSDWKIVVLVNRGSASGAEILAAALRDNLGATLVGEKTYGKGSVQKIFDLKDKSGLKITVRKWLTPKEEQISEKGLEPEIKLEEVEGKDLILEKAMEILKK
mgnify:CR=1 FL=1